MARAHPRPGLPWLTWLGYGAALAGFAFLLDWLDYRRIVRGQPTEIYVGAVALLFTVLGIWLGNRLTAPAPAARAERNDKAVAYLGISPRELEVLELLAAGLSNKQIARRLNVSPNTVKTHVGRLFEKLAATRRTEAIHKARELAILP